MLLISKRKPIAHCLLASVLLIGLVLSSCRGKEIPLVEGNWAKIKRIAILVKGEGDFSVRLSREKMSASLNEYANLDAPGLVLWAMEAGVRSAADQRKTDKLKPKADDFDPKAVMEERLNHYMKLANVFTTQDEEGKLLEGRKLDAILEITLKGWDLRLCAAPGSQKRVQVALDVHGRILLLEDRRTAWERNEFYLDGECYSVEDFLYREGLLKAVFIRALDNLSAKIVDEVCFPVIYSNFADLPEDLKKTPLKAIKRVNFALVVEDQRKPSERRRASDKEAPIAVFEAFEKELQDSGHKLVGIEEDSSDILIHIDLRECNVNQIGPSGYIELIWEINANVTVSRYRDRTALWSKSLEGSGNEPAGTLNSNVIEGREGFNIAVSKFVHSFSSDPGLFNALSLEANRKAGRGREVATGETREEIEGLIHNGPKLIAGGEYNQVLELIEDLPRETRGHIQIETLECFANLAGWVSH